MLLCKVFSYEEALRNKLMDITHEMFEYITDEKHQKKRFKQNITKSGVESVHSYPCDNLLLKVVRMNSGKHQILLFDDGDDEYSVMIASNVSPRRPKSYVYQIATKSAYQLVTDEPPKGYPPLDNFYFTCIRVILRYNEIYIRKSKQAFIKNLIREQGCVLKRLQDLYRYEIDI